MASRSRDKVSHTVSSMVFVGARRSSPPTAEVRYDCVLPPDREPMFPVSGARSEVPCMGSSRSSSVAVHVSAAHHLHGMMTRQKPLCLEALPEHGPTRQCPSWSAHGELRRSAGWMVLELTIVRVNEVPFEGIVIVGIRRRGARHHGRHGSNGLRGIAARVYGITSSNRKLGRSQG